MPEAGLPSLIVLTDRRQATRPLVDVVRAAVAGGARLVVLREKDLPDTERAALAVRLRAILEPAGGRLLLAGPPHGAPAAGGAPTHGVHLAAADPWPACPVGLIGRSCHTRAEVVAAAAGGAHYASLSPIFPSRSKPGYGPPLGTAVFADPVRLPLPVYALGGISTPQRAAACVTAGAAGVAVMGAVMRAEDPVRVVIELLDALDGAAVTDL